MNLSPSKAWLFQNFLLPCLAICLAIPTGAACSWAEEPAAKAPPTKSKPAAAKPAAEAKPAAKADAESKYVRVVRDAKGKPLTMDTAVVRFVPVDDKAGGKHAGLYVDLIGAVHIADKSYYDELNKRFTTYESMLFELVAPEGTKIPKGAKASGKSLISGIQIGMKNMLALEFQLEHVDYSQPNFVHADMSPEEFSKSMKDKGETPMQMFFDLMAQQMAQQAKGKGGGASEVDLLAALFAKDRPLKLKQVMAAQFEEMDDLLTSFGGKKGSTIINERNNKALAVLKKEIDGGKKKIAIFYGAGHMQDIEAKLLKDFGLKRDTVSWIPAWKLTK